MNTLRVKVAVQGAVQGVGFRPFVYRLATEERLKGWVVNSARGVSLEVEGPRGSLQHFLSRLEREKPSHAVIRRVQSSFAEAVGYRDFEIRESEDGGAKNALITPDIAACMDCLREMSDPANRRYRYPFINCTNCGPRFTIIESLPYDRANTSMGRFEMCADCAREYRDPLDRRFHAQPNACPRCGPQLAFWDADGNVPARRDEALLRAAEAVRAGQILALKGMGGFQLIVDARDEAAVARLRARKHREAKPFALMYPTLEAVRRACHVSALEEELLLSPEAPIVLLDRLTGPSLIAPSVAPGNPSLGVMLPCTPLHHLLAAELVFPVVATSGNLSDEPICTDEREALARLADIADVFLVHDRPIVRPMDDSVVREVRGREMMLRRARGYAPLPVEAAREGAPVLAVGAHLKNSVALSVGREVFLSQHIGDLATGPAFAAFRQVAADLPRLYDVAPAVVACDLHPDYLSSKHAAASAARVCRVQHHHAHVLACMADNELTGPVLGVAWDGTGYGPDGTVWGGEFLLVNDEGFERFARLRRFRLPGGEAAIREPRRSALGVLYEMSGGEDRDHLGTAPARGFSAPELALIHRMLARGLNSPLTSSAGRLFDAVASLLDLRQTTGYEGQAAMELEFAARAHTDALAYPFRITERGGPHVVDWPPMIRAILDDLRRGETVGKIAARFHATLAEMLVAVARKAGEPNVVLTGGCFQNRFLTELCIERLELAGFRPHWHRRVPPNDGGIALGQIIAAKQQPEYVSGNPR